MDDKDNPAISLSICSGNLSSDQQTVDTQSVSNRDGRTGNTYINNEDIKFVIEEVADGGAINNNIRKQQTDLNSLSVQANGLSTTLGASGSTAELLQKGDSNTNIYSISNGLPPSSQSHRFSRSWSQAKSSFTRSKNLSLSRARGSFPDEELEDLYKTYCVRSKYPLVLVYLCILVLMTAVFIFYNVAASETHDSVYSLGKLISLCVCFCYFFGLLISISIRSAKIFLKHPTAVSLGLNFGLLLFINLYFGFFESRTLMQDVPVLFYIIIVSYMILPMSRRWAMISGILVSLCHLLTAGPLSKHRSSLYLQLVCNFLVLLCANVIGLGHKFLSEMAHRHAFLEARNSVESMIKLDKDRQQQDGLLNSCFPSNLVEEMKKNLHNHMRDPKPSIFHDLYVQRYHNVSILYADIVNFTPLAA